MRSSTIFKSRWMALLWAAGILWFAYDFAQPDDAAATNNAIAEQQPTATDAGDLISAGDQQNIQDMINGL